MKVKVRAVDKRQFDISIVNPEDNLEMANLLNPVVKEFKNKNKICQSNRGFCFAHSRDFISWLDEEYPVLFKKLSKRGLKTKEGVFQIDYPNKLPLDINDLHSMEYEAFIDDVGEQYEDTDGDPVLIGELIWDWAQEHKDDMQGLLDDFYYMNHGWVEVDKLIIDFTWLQFRHAINDKVELKDRYEYD